VSASTLRIAEVPVSTLGSFLEACAAHSTESLQELADFAGFSVSTAKRAVPSLVSLGLVKRDGSGRFTVAVDGVRRGMDTAEREQVIRRGLLGFRPFETLVEGFTYGESVDDATRKALRLLDLPHSEHAKLMLLVRWGIDLGILEHVNGHMKLLAELSPSATEEMGPLSVEDVESEAKARLFNSRRLGRDANNYLDEIDRTLLADALLDYESDPRASINASGQALEDFLREIADDKGLAAEAKKASGAGQLANMLHREGVIHNHHQKMVDAAATIRNATAHRKDKGTLAPWELTPDGAFSALSMTLTVIRSIHHYVNDGRQTI
jgi:hypothetical protein